jgi:hypothetical protein
MDAGARSASVTVLETADAGARFDRQNAALLHGKLLPNIEPLTFFSEANWLMNVLCPSIVHNDP